MSIKYYTHFRLKESAPGVLTEYRGVVELSRAVSRSDSQVAAEVLARNFECASEGRQRPTVVSLAVSRTPAGLVEEVCREMSR